MEHRTALQLLAALRAGQVSAAELTASVISAIEAEDHTINAVVVRDFDRARAAARNADEARARGANAPLLGLPITIKESFDVAGLPTTWGVPGADQPAERDSAVVDRLKRAGAIILGKTNTSTMLADWQSANPIYGVTRNPWDLTRTPGGSSGGSAAALAAGISALEFGSDLASSLRCPAAFCGVYAHKPSYGLVPTAGFAPPGAPRDGPPIDLSVLGPMARSPADLELALMATAGAALAPPRHTALAAYRVLVLDEHPLVATAPVARAALAELAARLETAGCRVGRGSPLLPDLAELAETFQVLLMALFAEGGPRRDGADWAGADARRRAIADQWRSLFEIWDIVLCPAMPTAAFTLRGADPFGTVLAQDGVEIAYERQPLWGSLATVAGNPATSIPLGLTPDGLPIGAQAIGPLHEDRTSLAFAGMVERSFGGFVQPPRRQSSSSAPRRRSP